jgi:hypothetical protein
VYERPSPACDEKSAGRGFPGAETQIFNVAPVSLKIPDCRFPLLAPSRFSYSIACGFVDVSSAKTAFSIVCGPAMTVVTLPRMIRVHHVTIAASSAFPLKTPDTIVHSPSSSVGTPDVAA